MYSNLKTKVMSVEMDIYASVDIDVWNEHKDTIMAFSVDGRNYHDNECRETEEDAWNLNIRIDSDDLPLIDQYVEICDTKEINE